MNHYSTMTKSWDIDPSNVNALNNKGIALKNLKRYDESIQYYDKILAIDPSNVNALNNKAIALKNLKRYDESLQYYDKILEYRSIKC